MKKIILFIELVSILVLTGCADRQPHFIKNKSAFNVILKDFEEKKATLPHGNLFDACDNPELSVAEREAMLFLYAYMPLGDVTDYSSEFYLKNIRSSFKTMEEMSWCRNIPEDIFRHFVLPVRVNNENMDDSRTVFYEELKDRVKNLSLREAVLEVNHWCHEKVIYTPSDSRTSSPMASVRSAYGRCGEESVFTVAALRSVGIPARQVYTPRWAHTDDNHAWVEAWVDGKWHFMGACEPEPVLDMAWFNSPAYRSMLMHSKVFGRYTGPEDVMEQTAYYTEINVTGNYAPVAKLTATVVDGAGKPVTDATIEFKLYNYAEFFTVSRKITDANGQAFMTAGKGDMLLWAYKDGQFGFAKASFGKDDIINVVIDKKAGDRFDLQLDVVPPIEGTIPVEVTEEQKAHNAQRLAEEDNIRNEYVATFYNNVEAESFANILNIDTKKTTKLLIASRGNRYEIESFIRNAQDKNAAITLLENISNKDLRDATAEILEDHLLNSGEMIDESFIKYVQNPRISNEMLTPYKSFFQKNIPEMWAKGIKRSPLWLVQWIADSITVMPKLNPQRIPVSPVGVWKSHAADAHSRDIFFVAVLRSLGIPARIEPVAGKVQFIEEGKWADANFDEQYTLVPVKGTLTAEYTPTPAVRDPEYNTHFSIAQIQSNGSLRTLNFQAQAQVDMGLGDTWSRLLKNPLPIDTGNYILVTGSRMAKGNVLANISSFRIEPDRKTETKLVMRENKEDIQVLGNVDAEAKFILAESGKETSILSITGRGYFVIALLGTNQEPTNHAMRDIAALAEDFNKWGRSLIFLFKNNKDYSNFNAAEFGNLPSTITYGVDEKKIIGDMLSESMNTTGDLPVFVIADTFGRVVFISQGYTIGLGGQMLTTINKL